MRFPLGDALEDIVEFLSLKTAPSASAFHIDMSPPSVEKHQPWRVLQAKHWADNDNSESSPAGENTCEAKSERKTGGIAQKRPRPVVLFDSVWKDTEARNK